MSVCYQIDDELRDEGANLEAFNVLPQTQAQHQLASAQPNFSYQQPTFETPQSVDDNYQMTGVKLSEESGSQNSDLSNVASNEATISSMSQYESLSQSLFQDTSSLVNEEKSIVEEQIKQSVLEEPFQKEEPNEEVLSHSMQGEQYDQPDTLDYSSANTDTRDESYSTEFIQCKAYTKEFQEDTRDDSKVDQESTTEREDVTDIDISVNLPKPFVEVDEKDKSELERISNESKKSTEIREDTGKPEKRERKRKWGSSSVTGGLNVTAASSSKQARGISSDELKVLIPDLNKSNLQVSSKIDEATKDTKACSTPNSSNSASALNASLTSTTESAANNGKNGFTDRSLVKRSLNVSRKATTFQAIQDSEASTEDKTGLTDKFASESNEKETKREISPACNESSSIIFIRNLVRPFTLLQLKDLLGKSGKMLEDKFWIDKIKSKCYVTYETEQEAIAARESLHGLRWPEANPKTLLVDFANREELEYHLNLDKDPGSSKTLKLSKKGGCDQSGCDSVTKDQRKQEIRSSEKYDLAIRRAGGSGAGGGGARGGEQDAQEAPSLWRLAASVE